jgi:hypothetical protein
MKNILLVLLFSMSLSLSAYGAQCPNFSWETNYDNSKAIFNFKSTSDKEFKINEIIIYNDNRERTFVKNFSDRYTPLIIPPFGVKEYILDTSHLNPDMIKKAKALCISYLKGTGTRTYTSKYNYIIWEKTNNNFYTECDKFLKVICDGWEGVNRNKNEYGFKIGNRMGIYDKNGKAVSSFQVNQVIIDHKLNLCWLSEKKTVKLKDYLLLKKCYLYK